MDAETANASGSAGGVGNDSPLLHRRTRRRLEPDSPLEMWILKGSRRRERFFTDRLGENPP
jgi:hypothetical protein